METNESSQMPISEREALIGQGDNIEEDTLSNRNEPDFEWDAPAFTSFVRYAGFWMRFWAYLLDLVVIGSIERIIVNPLFRFMDIPLYEFNMFAPISIATAVVFYVYFVLMTKWFGQTLGKMVFGLKVIDLDGKPLSWGTVLFREWIGRFISTTVIIGYVIVAFLPKKQALHDIFVQTSVIHVEK